MIPHKDLTSEEKLTVENDLLKAKLTAEFGMLKSGTSLEPEMENQWLKHIYDFETAFAKIETIPIYEFIGRPEFKSIDKLKKEEISSELERLYDKMYKNNIVLEVICDYENEAELIYKFITEEFFALETDDVRIDGMSHIYSYEEFHPNYEYDLKRYSEEFLEILLEREFHREFDCHYLCEKVEFDNNEVNRMTFINIIIAFQETHKPIEVINREIMSVEFDLAKRLAEVNGVIKYLANCKSHSGEFKLRFRMDDIGYWCINGVSYPGLLMHLNDS